MSDATLQPRTAHSPLRLTYVVHHYPPAQRAGAELYTHRLARWMQAQGHSVEVICVDSIESDRADAVSARAECYEGVPVQRLAFRLVGTPDESTWRFDNPLLEQWMSAHLVRQRPSVVHFMAGYLIGAGPLRATRRATLPSVLTLHDYWFACPRHTFLRSDGALCTAVPADPMTCARCMTQGGPRTAAANRLTAGLYGAAHAQWMLRNERDALAHRRRVLADAITWPDVVLAPTHFLAARMRDALPAARVRVLPFGFDPVALPPPHAPTTSPGEPSLPVQVGYLGQIASHKGVHLLVEAFRSLPPTQAALHIYGRLESDPVYASRLRALAGDAPHIHFRGGYAPEALPAILGSLDAVAAPSIWYENAPLVIGEAFSAGLPVIASGIGGMAELVQDGVTGLHAPANDAAALAGVLRRFIEQPALRAALRAGVAARPSRTVADELREIESIYVELSRPAPAYRAPAAGIVQHMQEESHARGL